MPAESSEQELVSTFSLDECRTSFVSVNDDAVARETFEMYDYVGVVIQEVERDASTTFLARIRLAITEKRSYPSSWSV